MAIPILTRTTTVTKALTCVYGDANHCQSVLCSETSSVGVGVGGVFVGVGGGIRIGVGPARVDGKSIMEVSPDATDEITP